ncbi:MAG: hypothetical protein C5B51_27095 [Terriglobia bacterium]|nr:MAG: hypothetical protein C5B51_27095 [Terriglobia bacterium]
MALPRASVRSLQWGSFSSCVHNPQVTDGPFAETKEQLGGYYFVEANDTAEAIAMATKVPWARFGSIEVRPILTFA